MQDGRQHRAMRRVAQHPGGLAGVRIAFDTPATGVGRLAGDAECL